LECETPPGADPGRSHDHETTAIATTANIPNPT
jgi:hypothetical protein